ncbi:MAG TPA: DUF1328 domain-containing protein [Candidatus Kapabacteria bacterium]|nr:DUF1328 domain-containing protein [Candidatus Kapabacteria bacterium]
MLYWSIVFFVLAMFAAVFGFGGIPAAASIAGILKILFFVLLVAFVTTLVLSLIHRPPRSY